jgi:archaeal flagellar protein FlaF
METAITALIVIGVMLLAIVGLSDRTLSAQAALSESVRIEQEREGERVRTILIPRQTALSPTGDVVQVTMRNTGATRLADFARWDVIVEYADGVSQQALWLPYGTGVNQWSAQIYQDADSLAPEVFDPALLNPGEDLVVTVNLSPAVAEGSTNRLTLVTPNGVAAAATFTH